MTFETIKSLLFLTEADLPAKGEVAIEDLIKYFPSKHKAAIEKLWGTDRLTFHGEKFFNSSTDFGPVYVGVLAASNIGRVKCNIEVQPGNMPPTVASRKLQNYSEEVKDFEAEVGLNESQEVYLGYQPSKELLWIGYDAWVDSEELNGKIDEFIDELDDDITAKLREDIENYIETEVANQNMYGVLIGLKTKDGKNFTVVDEIVEPDGFYKGIFNSAAFKHLNLIDMRLD